MKVGGFNECRRLGEDSNTFAKYRCPCISPPKDSHLNISSLLSFSLYHDHTVWITNDNRAFAIGRNYGYQISTNLNTKTHEKDSPIILNVDSCHLISAVCGNGYTLYLFSDVSGLNHLAYFHFKHQRENPLLIDTKGHNPVRLFGGTHKAAAIDADGSILIITENVFNDNKHCPSWSFLPEGEKAVSVACSEMGTFVVSSCGRVFKGLLHGDSLSFSSIPELEGKDIIDVSGTYLHILAVCRDGRVFGLGTNFNGVLGLGEKSDSHSFTEIPLHGHKVKCASAGLRHSLFVTREGKVLACGHNECAELLIGRPGYDVCSPVETLIEGATFCIAGDNVSAVFVGAPPPPNMPNMPFRDTDIAAVKKNDEMCDDIKLENEKLKAEIEKLRKENQEKTTKNDMQSAEIARLRMENDMKEEEIAALKKQIEQYKAKIPTYNT